MSGHSDIQDAARLGRVALHLRTERLERLEALLVAQSRDEFNLDLAAIKITVKVEHVRFEKRLGTTDRGTRAEARDTYALALGYSPHTAGEDPGDRCPPALERHVGGGEAQLCPEIPARLHPSAHRPGASQPAPRTLKVAARQCRADAAAADTLAIEHHRREHIKPEAEPPSRLCQDRGGRFAVLREAEVVSDHDYPRGELTHQQLRERFSGEVTQRLAETQQPEVIEPQPREDPPACAQA